MAFNVRKTEHSGSKKGRGAYWGEKADAKAESKRKRRINGKREITSVTSEEEITQNRS